MLSVKVCWLDGETRGLVHGEQGTETDTDRPEDGNPEQAEDGPAKGKPRPRQSCPGISGKSKLGELSLAYGEDPRAVSSPIVVLCAAERQGEGQ